MTSPSQPVRLVADVGGTNTRLALFDPHSGELRGIRSYTNRDEASFEALITRWLEALEEPAPVEACIAVAAPPDGDCLVMSNMDWTISRRALIAKFGFGRIRVINDFESNAYALPQLKPDDLAIIHPGTPSDCLRLATIGPGTGLGGSILEQLPHGRQAVACEPGHMGLGPMGRRELDIWEILGREHPRIYNELLVSGPGLVRLHTALRELQGLNKVELSAEQISQLGAGHEDPVCVEALTLFCRLFGAACADFVLANGSYGGLYLAGGIVPKMLRFFETSGFRERFIDRGPVSAQLARMPIFVVTHPYQGLLGAGNMPLG